MGSKVTKHDVFHSEIYYNTTTRGPRKEPGGGGVRGRGAGRAVISHSWSPLQTGVGRRCLEPGS